MASPTDNPPPPTTYSKAASSFLCIVIADWLYSPNDGPDFTQNEEGRLWWRDIYLQLVWCLYIAAVRRHRMF